MSKEIMVKFICSIDNNDSLDVWLHEDGEVTFSTVSDSQMSGDTRLSREDAMKLRDLLIEKLG